MKIKIPKETQTNKVFRIRNKGIKNLRSNTFGDLFCKIIIETPIDLNENQIKILQDFETSINKSNTPKITNWKNIISNFINKN